MDTYPQKILVILFGAIGDVTRALPLVTRLKRSWPNAQITWAVEPISKSLVENHPAIDKILVFDRPRGFSGYLEFLRKMRSQNFDLTLDLQRHFKSGVTSLLSRAPRRVCFHRKNSREFNWIFNTEQVPAAEHFSSKVIQYQAFGDYLGLAVATPLDFGLQPTKLARQTALEILNSAGRSEGDRLVGLLLGSTWETRLWPVEYYQELIQRMHVECQLVPVLIGAKSERVYAAALTATAKVKLINLVEKTSLGLLPAVFSEMLLAVGSDSGPMHIAAASGIPVVSLWGPTSPERSQPWGSEQWIMQGQADCSPCYLKQCPGLGTICMKSILPEAVSMQVSRIVKHG
ncbi:glycosyltransferase family 9 protein [bacterium]|nr:glycosyltransferase family 9 protein [bacterium]